MATKARIVYGASTEWSSDGGTTYTNIDESTAIVVPETSVDYQDVSSLDSTGGFREYIPGLKDAGEISIPCNYTSAMYALASGYRSAGTLIKFQTTLPLETGQSTTGDVFVFEGYVSPALETNSVGDPISLTLNIRTSGAVSFTEGS